jgi:hypothetical protein
MAVSSVSVSPYSTQSIASSTSSNWLAEAQSAIQSTDSSGGIMGALQSASQTSSPGSISSFLANSQNEANSLASIMQSSIQDQGQLYAQIAAAQGQQAAQDRFQKEAALLNPPTPTNFTPPKQLDPIVFYDDGSSLDTTSNIMTLSNGSQIDVTTGLSYVAPKSLVDLGNGAYLNTSTNILTEADGTKVNSITGLKVSTTA